jgi:transposase
MKSSNGKFKKVSQVIRSAESLLSGKAALPSHAKTVIQDLVQVTKALVNQLGLNSSNSSIPPSQDPHRKKRKKVKGKRRKPGGQKGHKGSCLRQTETPDETVELTIDRKSLPKGKYKHGGFESRQVFDAEFTVHVTEYRAEILKNERGDQFVAEFPDGVTESAQYGNSVKAHSVYLSQFQMIPLQRVTDYFINQLGLTLSKGSVANFNEAAAKKLNWFESWAKRELIRSPVINGDETGINVDGKGHWLHCLSGNRVTLFHVDTKRGQEAMERMGILPYFRGVLVHDHWKPYFTYEGCDHSLCNAHHLRELERAYEQDGQIWAKEMAELLEEINDAVCAAGGKLGKKEAKRFRTEYRRILKKAQRECPDSGRRAQSKSRNLLVRLKKFEKEVLRFMSDRKTPFTNNQGERDIRMTKVQQKISGCFRSLAGAKNFALIRSYLLTCQKNGIDPSAALDMLFEGRRPPFISS